MFDFDILSDSGDDLTADRRGFAPFRRLALIGNALPRKCGLATYTSHVADALRELYPDMTVDHYAMDDGTGVFYPSSIRTIDAESLDDYQAAAERWIRARVATAGMEIEAAGARLLAERCGTDLKRLRNDLDRLLLYAMGQKVIARDDVRDMVGPAALQDDWAMTNAIEAGNGAAALQQLALLLESGAPPEKILGQLGWLVRSKLPAAAPARVRQSVEAVFRTDLDLKRSAGDPRVLLERLVVELCGGVRAVGPRS